MTHGADTGHAILRTALLVGAAVSVTLCGCIAAQRLIIGSQPAGWFYGYQQHFDLRFLGVWLIALIPALALLFDPHAKRRAWVSLALWLAAAGWMQVVLRSIAPYTLETLLPQSSWWSRVRHFRRRSAPR